METETQTNELVLTEDDIAAPIGYSIIYPKPFDVMDAALEQVIPKDWIAFSYKREQITSGSIVYRLFDSRFGEIGEIKLVKISNTETRLEISNARYPDYNMSNPNWIEERAKTREKVDRYYKNLIRRIINFLHYDFAMTEKIIKYIARQSVQRTQARQPQLGTATANHHEHAPKKSRR